MQLLHKTWRRAWLIAAFVHLILCTAGFWTVAIVGFAVADSNLGTAPWWLAPLEKLLTFVLLQPLAYWVFASDVIRYWTWFGLWVSIGVFVVNSVLAIAIVHVAVRIAAQRGLRPRV
jgi:hypothetical protein